jgi:hypothetical protein
MKLLAFALLASITLAGCSSEKDRAAIVARDYKALKHATARAYCSTDPAERAHGLSALVAAAAEYSKNPDFSAEDEVYDIASDFESKGCPPTPHSG